MTRPRSGFQFELRFSSRLAAVAADDGRPSGSFRLLCIFRWFELFRQPMRVAWPWLSELFCNWNGVNRL